MRVELRVVQDSGNEKSGQHKEEIDSDPACLKRRVERLVQENRRRRQSVSELLEMKQEDQENRHTTDAVQNRNVDTRGKAAVTCLSRAGQLFAR